MRMFIIAVVALLVLGGGGAGAYFYFSKSAEAAPPEAAKEVADGHDKTKKEDKKKGGGGHGEGGTEFVELDPLILPIIDNSGVTQTVSMVIALEVQDKAKADEVKKLTPRLKDAYIQDMYGILNNRDAFKGGVLQIVEIKGRLSKITTEVLGEDMVDDVLLQVVQQRPI